MSAFSDAELAYLTGERRLGRLPTIGRDGMPHVAPLGWSYNAELDTIDSGGRDLPNTFCMPAASTRARSSNQSPSGSVHRRKAL